MRIRPVTPVNPPVCVLVLILALASIAAAAPYRHTIVIDGFDDFTSGERFATTTSGHEACFSWDDDALYLGGTGSSLDGASVFDYFAVYLDVDPGSGLGAAAGRPLFDQQPAFDPEFRPEYLYLMSFDYSSQSVWAFAEGAWSPIAVSVSHAHGNEYFEAAIPLADLGDPAAMNVTYSLVYAEDYFGWTYGGAPDDIYVDGYDPDYQSHLEFDFAGEYDPNDPPPPATVTIDPEPWYAGWILDGPDAFNAVGQGDSTLVDLDPGDYTVTWYPLDGYLTPASQQQTLAVGGSITFVGGYTAAPLLTEVGDVPDDQGGRVRLVWKRVAHDAPGSFYAITGYEIYRRQDGAAKRAGWDYLATAPAHGDEIYQYVAETLCDSTDAGVCWSVFLIRAVTYDPFTFFESPPDSGVSTDDLAPSVPTGLARAGGVLTWDDPVDADFRYFTVYGSPSPELDGAAVVIDRVTGTSLDAGGLAHAYYHLTATDFAGNEGAAATLFATTGAAPSAARTALHPCAPNPFNPSTTIAYETARDGPVTLAVYDAAGRIVRTLVREIQPSGSHSARWDGLDDAGRRAGSGVYLCRLLSGGETRTTRLLLLK